MGAGPTTTEVGLNSQGVGPSNHRDQRRADHEEASARTRCRVGRYVCHRDRIRARAWRWWWHGRRRRLARRWWRGWRWWYLARRGGRHLARRRRRHLARRRRRLAWRLLRPRLLPLSRL